MAWFEILSYFKFATDKTLKLYINDERMTSFDDISFSGEFITYNGLFTFLNNNNESFEGNYSMMISELNNNNFSAYVVNGTVSENSDNKTF